MIEAKLRIALLTGSILAATASGAMAVPTDYNLLTTIAVPATAENNQGGAVTAFDISYVDASTGDYYFADRSNASVDIINGATNMVVAQAGGFAGQLATTSISGPDGVVVVNNGTTATLYAGDGGSTLRSFNVTNPANPIAGGTVNTGGGQFRVDEMAYSPATSQLFVANNANTPSFGSLISTTNPLAPSLTTSPITVPGQVSTGGLEQSVWDPATGTFFVSVPTFNGTDAGGVEEFSATGAPLHSYSFGSFGISSCSSAGLALGASGNLLVGCANAGTQTIILDPTSNGGNGSIVATLSAVSGSDEVWYDPATGNFYVTGVNAAGDRVIAVVSDSGYALLQSIDLTSIGAGDVNAHSVAVDPLDNEIFVPLEGTVGSAVDTLCPNGCVAVFAVPEPASLPMFILAVAGFFGLARVVRRTS